MASGRLAHAVTWKQLVFSIAGGFLVLAGFAAWLIDRAEAATAAAGARAEAAVVGHEAGGHAGVEARINALTTALERVEGKVDQVLLLACCGIKPEPPADVQGPRLLVTPDPVPPWIKVGRPRP